MGRSAGVIDPQVDGRNRGLREGDFQDFREGQRGEKGGICLNHHGLLTLGEEGAFGLAVAPVEEMVNEMGGKRDEVGRKKR